MIEAVRYGGLLILVFCRRLSPPNAPYKIRRSHYELIDKMEDGEEIIFADEYGSWMIPGNEKEFLDSYISSLSKVKTPEEYTQILIPLLKRDSYSSFCNQVYSIALKHSNEEQGKHLKDEIKKQNIKIKSNKLRFSNPPSQKS